MKEVQFWFIMEILYLRRYKKKVVPHEYQLYIDSIVDSICMLFGIKSSVIKYAIGKINKTMFLPTNTELILASKYLDIPVRDIMKVSRVGNRKLYTALENYINNDSIDLAPRFDQDVYLEIEKFNKAVEKLLNDINSVSKISSLVYDDYEIL